MTPIERMRLEGDLTRFQGTVDTLTQRLQHILIALALTYDAQAATRQRLNRKKHDHDHLDETVADLQTAAEQYRHLARALTNYDPEGGGTASGSVLPLTTARATSPSFRL